MTANAGYHLFNTGDVLTASQVQYNLQNQTIMYFASSAARTSALSGVVVEGMFSYLADTNSTEYYDGAAWQSISNPGDITGVTAGTGISGGGTSGTVTVSIDTAVTVDKTTAQTLTNKTLTSPIISSISNTGTLTLPTSTDTLVGRATTDTLTNKTLTSPALTTPTISTLTTAGDTVYGTGSGVLSRLGIGTAGQVLTVNSGATAPQWSTASGSGGMTLLDTVTLSGASVTSASLSGSYKNLQIIIKNQKDNTSDSVQLRCNNDANTSYFWAGYYAQNASGTNSFTTYTSTNSGRGYFAVAYVGGGTSTNGDQMVFNIYRYTDTGATLIEADSVFLDSGTLNRTNVTGIYKNSSAITSVTLLMASGSFSSGTMYIYGVS